MLSVVILCTVIFIVVTCMVFLIFHNKKHGAYIACTAPASAQLLYFDIRRRRNGRISHFPVMQYQANGQTYTAAASVPVSPADYLVGECYTVLFSRDTPEWIILADSTKDAERHDAFLWLFVQFATIFVILLAYFMVFGIYDWFSIIFKLNF